MQKTLHREDLSRPRSARTDQQRERERLAYARRSLSPGPATRVSEALYRKRSRSLLGPDGPDTAPSERPSLASRGLDRLHTQDVGQHPSDRHLPVRTDRHQAKSVLRHPAGHTALGSPVSEGQITASPFTSPTGSVRSVRPIGRLRGSPLASDRAEPLRQLSQSPLGTAPGFSPRQLQAPLQHGIMAGSAPTFQEPVGVQGLAAMRPLPEPARNALLNIVDRAADLT